MDQRKSTGSPLKCGYTMWIDQWIRSPPVVCRAEFGWHHLYGPQRQRGGPLGGRRTNWTSLGTWSTSVSESVSNSTYQSVDSQGCVEVSPAWAADPGLSSLRIHGVEPPVKSGEVGVGSDGSVQFICVELAAINQTLDVDASALGSVGCRALVGPCLGSLTRHHVWAAIRLWDRRRSGDLRTACVVRHWGPHDLGHSSQSAAT